MMIDFYWVTRTFNQRQKRHSRRISNITYGKPVFPGRVFVFFLYRNPKAHWKSPLQEVVEQQITRESRRMVHMLWHSSTVPRELVRWSFSTLNLEWLRLKQELNFCWMCPVISGCSGTGWTLPSPAQLHWSFFFKGHQQESCCSASSRSSFGSLLLKHLGFLFGMCPDTTLNQKELGCTKRLVDNANTYSKEIHIFISHKLTYCSCCMLSSQSFTD